MARYESQLMINGKEIDVFADTFDQGPGISYGPTEIWAELDGKEYTLTQEQEDQVFIAAAQWSEENSNFLEDYC